MEPLAIEIYRLHAILENSNMTYIYLSRPIYTIAQFYMSLLFLVYASFSLLIVLSRLDFVVISRVSCVPVGFSLLMGFITMLSTYPFLLFKTIYFLLLYAHLFSLSLFTIPYTFRILSTKAKYEVYRWVERDQIPLSNQILPHI